MNTKKKTSAKALSGLTPLDGHIPIRKANNDVEHLHQVVLMKENIFPTQREDALLRLDGNARREVVEQVARDSTDGHINVRVMAINMLSLESKEVLEAIKGNRKEPNAIRDAAMQRYSGLTLLRKP